MYYNNYNQQDAYGYDDDYNDENDLMSSRSNAEANYGNKNPTYVKDLERIMNDNHKVYKQKRLQNGDIIYTKQNKHSEIPINENTTFYACFAYALLHSLDEFNIDATKQVGINSFKNGGDSLKKQNTIYNAMLNVLQLGTTLGYDPMNVYFGRSNKRVDPSFMSIIRIEDEYLKYGDVSRQDWQKATQFYQQQIDDLVRSIPNDETMDTFCALYVLAYDFGFSDIKEHNWCLNPRTGKLTNIDYDSGLRNRNVETPSLFIPPSFPIRKQIFTNYIENSPYLKQRLNYVRNRIDKVVSQTLLNNGGLWSQHYTNLLSRAHDDTMQRKLNNMTNDAILQGIDPITQIYKAYSDYKHNFSYNNFNRILPRTARTLDSIYDNKCNIYNRLITEAEHKKYGYKQNKLQTGKELYNHKAITPENNKAIFFNKQIVNNNINNYQQQNVQNKYYSDEKRLYEEQQRLYGNALPPINNNRFQQYNGNGNRLYNNRRMTPNNSLPPINNKYYDYQARKIMGEAI